MYAIQNGRGQCPAPTTLAVLLALTACGPGNVAPDDDAQGDDDAITDDDTTVGDDDAATGGTGTISVTVEVLAVLAEGQSVEAEIVVDGTPTGVFAPAEIETDSGTHTVTLKANEPNAPVPERFVAAPHEVSVFRDGTIACPMFLGRDLTGRWRNVEEGGSTVLNDEPFDVQMSFGPMGRRTDSVEPCMSLVWGGALAPWVICVSDPTIGSYWKTQTDPTSSREIFLTAVDELCTRLRCGSMREGRHAVRMHSSERTDADHQHTPNVTIHSSRTHDRRSI